MFQRKIKEKENVTLQDVYKEILIRVMQVLLSNLNYANKLGSMKSQHGVFYSGGHVVSTTIENWVVQLFEELMLIDYEDHMIW